MPTRLSVLRFCNPTGSQRGLGVAKLKPRPQPSGAAGLFVWTLRRNFARIHPSPKGSLRLDDSDDFDKPAVARQSGKIVHRQMRPERSAWLDVHPGSFPFDHFAGWCRANTCTERGQYGFFTGRKHDRQHAAWDAQSRTAAATRQSQCVELFQRKSCSHANRRRFLGRRARSAAISMAASPALCRCRSLDLPGK